jgi:aspartokinase
MKIGGIVEQGNLILYSITSLKDIPGAAGRILKLFAFDKINLQFITEGSLHKEYAFMSFCVDSEDGQRVDDLLHSQDEFQSHLIRKREFVCMLGVYGPHFREKPGIAALFCSTLGEAGVNIMGISSSISTISCVIDVRDLEKAKEATLTKFELP